MAGELTREQVVGIVESLTSDKVDGVLAYDLLTHDALLRQRVEALERELDDAVVGERHNKAVDAVTIADLTAKLETCEAKYKEEYAIVDRIWKQLGVTEYTGKSIYEYITALQRQLQEREETIAKLETMNANVVMERAQFLLETVDQRARLDVLEGALRDVCKEVRSYTSTVQYAGRESCLKDLDRRERLLLDQCDKGEAALATREKGEG